MLLGWVGVAVAGWKDGGGDDKNGCDDSQGDECHSTGHKGAVGGGTGNMAIMSLCLIILESVFRSHSVPVDSGEYSGLNSRMALFPWNM